MIPGTIDYQASNTLVTPKQAQDNRPKCIKFKFISIDTILFTKKSAAVQLLFNITENWLHIVVEV
jgi:hypothetical protein